MYAAAGGASLASRQARQRQRQNKKLQQVKAQTGKELKTPQPKQYHNYTDDGAPKLSRVERGTLLRPPLLQSTDRRHSTSQCHLKEPTRSRLRESPSISIPVHREIVPRDSSPLPVLPTVPTLPEDGRLERRCSFVRQVEQTGEERGLLDKCNHLCNYEIKDNVWETTFPDLERDVFGSVDYPFSECSQGRAAWQERGRRCSLSEEARQHRLKQTEAHHRWMKRNRIHDSTYGTGSEEDDFFSVYHQSAAANALLYVGLGTTAIGSVIFFVGTGDKGFKTLELRLIGPTLVACGILCCLIRVLLCACPSTCFRRKKTRIKDTCPHAPPRYPKPHEPSSSHHHHIDNVALLSRKKQVSIVPPSNPMPSTSNRQPTVILPPTTSPPHQLQLPTINLPSDPSPDTVIELQQFTYDLCDVSSNESEDDRMASPSNRVESPKHKRPRQPVNQDVLTVVIEKSDDHHHGNDKHSGIVLSPLQLGQ